VKQRTHATGVQNRKRSVMKCLMIEVTLVAVLIAGTALVNFAQIEVDHTNLPNFHKINSQVYRGAQPKPGGMQRLAQLGIRTVINLRDDDERAQVEQAEVRAAGMQYFNVPLKNLGKPADEQVKRILEIISAPENAPVFVHCKRGADRTGTIIAIYRIAHDGWTKDQAQAEANQYGMGFWQRGMKSYIADYFQRLQLKRNCN
jgi:tyrosine-protein phosphatase SIW14